VREWPDILVNPFFLIQHRTKKYAIDCVSAPLDHFVKDMKEGACFLMPIVAIKEGILRNQQKEYL